MAELMAELMNLPGIGAKTAANLIGRGLASIAELHKFYEWLPNQTKIYLDNKIKTKIPFREIEKIENRFVAAARPIKLIFVGSYRRKAPYSGDIDILVLGEIGVLDRVIKKIQKKFGNVKIIMAGADRSSLVIAGYKIDLFRADKENKWAALLYSTGSKNHNIIMRARAKKMGMKLNQRGLYRGNKLISGAAKSEKWFFDKLKMEYKAPVARS